MSPLDRKPGVWKSGRGRGRATPKGRQPDDAAVAEVRRLLGDAPRRRDLLVEHLHRLQDAHGCLTAAHLAALAAEMRLSQAQVFEVASFYAHFDIVADGAAPPPPLTVRVCDGVACMLAGCEALLAALDLGPGVRVLRAPCVGRCDRAPVAVAGRRPVDHATPAAVAGAVAAGVVEPDLPEHPGLDGYPVLAALRAGVRTRDAVQADVLASGLRGMGGAGFPAGRKWAAVRGGPAPRLLCVNADEGEPGTFKDRFFLETQPHAVLEGMLIAAWAIEAEACVIYLRDEYPAARAVLRREIAALEAAGVVAPGFIDLRRGAGAYVCGEESAMIESIEGKRGLPRHRPPYVAQAGLRGRPTLVHNVETLFWVQRIAAEGPDVFGAHGENGRKGLRHFSVSGRVRAPGVKLAPAGITLRRLIDEHCGGMAEGHALRAFLPGGASGGVLPAALADAPLDFDTLQPHGALIGSAAVVVLSDRDDLRAVALNLMRFFEHESCGQCTPCRVGCEKAAKLMGAPHWNRPLLEELGRTMEDASICGLGQAAPNAFRSLLRWFPELT